MNMDTDNADREWGIDIPETALAPGRTPTVANWVEEYKVGYFAKIADTTKLAADRELKAFALWFGHRTLSRDLVIQFCSEQTKRRIGGSALQRAYSTIRPFLRWCERMGYVEGQVAFLVPHLQLAEKPALRFEADQYIDLKEAAKGTVFYYASVMAYRTGMRLSDVCLLKWENIDLENLTISYMPFKTRRKGIRAVCPIESGGDLHEVILDMDKSRSTHPMWAPYVCPGLAMYYPKNGGILAMFRGSCHSPFKKYCRAIGAGNLSFHKLRNSFMSRMVDADVNWPKVCQITGLKTFSVLMRYSKPNTGVLRKDMEKLSKVEAEQAATGTKLLTAPNA